MKLLLLSNSTKAGEPYLDWPLGHISQFCSGISKVLFVPYAGVTVSYDDYAASVREAFAKLNIKVESLHQQGSMSSAIAQADCIVVGGGNTFSLMSQIHNHELLFDLRDAVKSGTRFIGWSAGSNVACPTIKTTNDMPIEEPKSFGALNLIPFQINPHYTEATIPNHGGESRRQRIMEFLEKNQSLPVIGLPEGMLLEVRDEIIELKGEGSGVLFKYGEPDKELKPGIIVI